MKKASMTFIFAATALLLLLALHGTAGRAFASGTYAYLPADTPLYAATGDGYEVKVNLPSTYFVSVLSSSGYYYRVGYGDISGYVRQTAVQTVDYEPVSKFALGTAKLKSGIASVYLYEKADLTTAVATVGAETTIETYGSVSAQETVYYCRIVANDKFFYGYLSATVADFTMPPENDVRAVTPEPDPNISDTPPNPENGAGLGQLPIQVILVLCLVIPSIVVVMLLFSDKSKKKKKL